MLEIGSLTEPLSDESVVQNYKAECCIEDCRKTIHTDRDTSNGLIQHCERVHNAVWTRDKCGEHAAPGSERARELATLADSLGLPTREKV